MSGYQVLPATPKKERKKDYLLAKTTHTIATIIPQNLGRHDFGPKQGAQP